MMKHAEVPAALDLVVDEVGKESQRILDAGSVALKAGKLDPAEEAIAYAKRLAQFVRKVRALGEEWKSLQDELDKATPEVKEIVLPTQSRPHKTGYTRKVEKVAPKTNFTVTFPDGRVIADKKAKVVFGKSIERLGADAVADLKIVLAAEPLVSRDKAVFKKEPTQVQAIAGGWFVKTHCSAAAKMQLLEKIAKSLKIKLRIELCK